MKSFLTWTAWPFLTLSVSLLALILLLLCCKSAVLKGGPDDPGGSGKPLPIYGYVFDNGPTSDPSCAYDPLSGDTPVSGSTIVIKRAGVIVTTLVTMADGYYGATVSAGTYEVELLNPPKPLCPLAANTNPRTGVPVTVGVNHREDFALQSATATSDGH